jgi:isoleucyl-tRNA synthetase
MSTMSTETGEKQSKYKGTLNLPKTSFAMKANLVQNEPASLKRWESMGLYAKVQELRLSQTTIGGTRFVFHDGPPYANAQLHLGHLLNKCLKDFVVRVALMEGRACPFIPGWDCHGLPIEHKVIQDLASKGKLEKLAALDADARRMAIRRECRAHAEKSIKIQMEQMKRLLTLADYPHPYLTMDPAYEGATLEVFADLVEAGLVYRQLKSVHWSPANETALAEAELEYYDREDPSIYVDFEAEDQVAVYRAFGLPEEDIHHGVTEGTEEDVGGWSSSPRTHDPSPTTSAPSQRPCFMIWTTTPWTLPANVAIAVHKDAEYALVRLDGNVTVVAKDLLGRVAKAGNAEQVEVLAAAKGSRLVGLKYRHPLYAESPVGMPQFSKLPAEATRHADRSWTNVYSIVAAEYVTLEDGTGLVHTAPGHGADDYRTGLAEKLPIYCPVRENGAYDATVPAWLHGKSIWDANAEIVQFLERSGHLFHHHRFTHSYPHDWRGKTPVIFRATEQWFIGVDTKASRHRGIKASISEGRTLRELALQQTDAGVRFVPEWGKNRMRGMLESRPDWCISRQRAWGLPIPAFFARDGRVLLTPASARAVARLVREKGSDAWFTGSPAELLKHYDPSADTDAPKGLDLGSLTKGMDIFDVWFESGCSWNSVIRERSRGAPALREGCEPGNRPGTECRATTEPTTDLYLEGSDQHRGWFQVSLLTALGATGVPPYRTLLTHGFIVDKDGKKMSKSLGNTLDVDDLLKEFGADVCRWWVATLAYDGDIKADIEFFRTSGEAYRKVRNTLRFMLSNLDDFEATSPDTACGCGRACVPREAFREADLDSWALARFDALSRDVRAAYAAYDYRAATTRLYDFCNETLSAVYLDAVKDRLYCEPPASPRRRKTQTALYELTDGLCRLLAPILPHTADEAWRSLVKADPKDAERSVHLLTFAEENGVQADAAWDAVMQARAAGLVALEHVRQTSDLDNPLDAAVILPDPEKSLGRFDATDLADLLGVSRVMLDSLAGTGEATVQDLRAEPRCERSWKRDGTVRQRSDGGMLCDRCAKAVGV